MPDRGDQFNPLLVVACAQAEVLEEGVSPMREPGSDYRIDYIEFGSTDIQESRRFYSSVFGWEFTDYGPNYTSFQDGRLAGGFTTESRPGASPLVVLFASNLEEALSRVT